MAQGRHHQTLGRHPVVRGDFIGNELRIGQDQTGPLHGRTDTPFDLGQPFARLGLGVVEVGQVVHGHHRGAVEVHRLGS